MKIGHPFFSLKLFFKHIASEKQIFRNIFWLGLGEAFTRLTKFVVIVLIARIFLPEMYGKFSFAFNFAAIFLMLANFGTGRLIVRDINRGLDAKKILPHLYGFRILTSIITYIIVCIFSLYITPDPLIRQLIILFGLFITFSSLVDFYFALFQGYQHFYAQTILQIFQSIIFLVGGLLIAWKGSSLKAFAWLYVGCAIATLIMATLYTLFKYKIYFLPKINFRTWKTYLYMAWPIALGGILTDVFARLDSVMMGHWRQFQAVGWYNANYRIIGLLLGIGVLISYAFFPTVSRATNIAKERLLQLFKLQFIVMGLVLVPILSIGLFYTPQIIKLLYGKEFLPAVFSLRILLLALGCSYFFLPLKNFLIIVNKQQIFLILISTAVIMNFILNYLLIPKYSLNGASVATLLTYLFLLASTGIWCFGYLKNVDNEELSSKT